MRKFKHKNTGIVGQVRGDNLYFNSLEKYNGDHQECISFDFAVRSNDWEECIADYKILRIRDKTGGTTMSAIESINDVFTKLVTEGWVIESVENKFGKVFSLGDKIKSLYLSDTTIKKFYFKEGILVFDTSNPQHFLSFNVNIASLEHYTDRISIFTTTDGVDLYEGDIYWACHRNDDTSLSGSIAKQSGHVFDSSVPTFSTEALAREYVKMNKPEFSRKQVIEFLEKASPFDINKL